MEPVSHLLSHGQIAPELADLRHSINELRRAVEKTRASITDAQRVSAEATRILSLSESSALLPTMATLRNSRRNWSARSGKPG